MDNISLIKTFGNYLKQHAKNIFIFIVFAAIFAIVFYLYRLPVEAVAYATLLCFFILIAFVLFDFGRYYKQHRILTELKNKIIFGLDELPMCQNLIEEDYNELIKVIHYDKIRIISEDDNAKSDMTDYYTLWAHQIKTPIAAMKLLLQSNDTDENNELLTELFKIEQYVDMVLSYLRLDSNSTDFVIKKYSLDSIVKQAVRKYAHLFVRKKISLDLNNIDCEILTDEKWLSFAIEQILSNALKYTAKGRISIYMGENKTLIIKDTGIGIAEEDLPRICEKGFTGYNGRTDKKATGIGLYLCKRVLNKLSHSIVVKSEVSKGTEVWIGLDTKDIIVE